MIAVDTNIVVRLLTGDDPVQTRRAAQLMESDTIFIPKTVLLEVEWVLRHAYGIGREAIAIGFQKLLGLAQVRIENPEAVFQALVWYQDGFDFADALHLSASREAEAFASFDRAFVRKARKYASLQVVIP